jgi:hypothetical protein
MNDYHDFGMKVGRLVQVDFPLKEISGNRSGGGRTLLLRSFGRHI